MGVNIDKLDLRGSRSASEEETLCYDPTNLPN